MKYFLVVFFLFIYLLPSLHGQESDSSGVVTIITHDKQYFDGDLIEITDDSIFIKSEQYGILAFNKKKVKSIQDGALLPFFIGTTNSSVPFYVQTAKTNGEGNHYYKNYYVFGNEFNFGISDNLNLTFGFESASLIFSGGDFFPVIQLGAKYGVPVTSYLDAGVSMKYYFNNEGSALLVSTPFTVGNERTNFTLSPTMISSDGSREIGLFSNLSLAASSKVRFLFDFARIDGENVLALNFEYMNKGGSTIAFGGIITRDGSAPALSFSIPFGRWKKRQKIEFKSKE